MWSISFDARLAQWAQLREQAQSLDLPSALATINHWWQTTPWQPYYLHWDDQERWPDPWQLLSDNVYCDVARSLGMLYTISMLDRADMADAELVLTADSRNLVLVDKSKYILNYSPEQIVNISSQIKITRRFKQYKIK